jgi:hypothetical protein
VAVIAWYLDLQLPMHSVSITDVVSSNLDQSEVYNITKKRCLRSIKDDGIISLRDVWRQ